MIDFRSLVKEGLHFGHQTSRWCPKMAPYIWGQRNGVHLIDISKTAFGLDRAAKFLEEITTEGKSVLWVGTKKPAQDVIAQAAQQVDMPYVTSRWVGGTLTNNSQVAKSVTKLMHLEDVLQKSEDFTYTKKELNVFGKMVERLGKTVGGLKNLSWPLGAVIVIDVRKEATVIKEAVSAGIPVIGLVDTNCDPTGIDYVIPGNDDSPKAIRAVVSILADAASKGVAVAQEREKAAREAAEAEKKAKAEARKVAADKKAAEKKPAAKKADTVKADAKTEAKPAAKKAAPKADAKQAAKKADVAEKKPAAKKTAAKADAKPAAKKATPTKKAADKDAA